MITATTICAHGLVLQMDSCDFEAVPYDTIDTIETTHTSVQIYKADGRQFDLQGKHLAAYDTLGVRYDLEPWQLAIAIMDRRLDPTLATKGK